MNVRKDLVGQETTTEEVEEDLIGSDAVMITAVGKSASGATTDRRPCRIPDLPRRCLTMRTTFLPSLGIKENWKGRKKCKVRVEGLDSKREVEVDLEVVRIVVMAVVDLGVVWGVKEEVEEDVMAIGNVVMADTDMAVMTR